MLVQSFQDEFTLQKTDQKYKAPAEPGGQVLERGSLGNSVGPEEQKEFHSMVGKLLYLSSWSWSDVSKNAVQELSHCCGVAKKLTW